MRNCFLKIINLSDFIIPTYGHALEQQAQLMLLLVRIATNVEIVDRVLLLVEQAALGYR
jgi:hypothetical protein